MGRCTSAIFLQSIPSYCGGTIAQNFLQCRVFLQDPRRIDTSETCWLNCTDAQDFLDAAQQLVGVFMAPAVRVVHQIQLMMLSFARGFHWSSETPISRMMWNVVPPSVAEPVARELRSAAQCRNSSSSGLVILISNRTADSVVDHMLSHLDGPSVLFLEDTCGDAQEALHSGGQAQERCLRPRHAGHLLGARSKGRHFHVAWRRHASTFSVAHSAQTMAA